MNKITLLIFILITSLAYSQNYTPVKNGLEVQNKIIESNQSTKTLQATFVQEKHMSILNKPFISNGVFYMKQPEKVRWEYQTPFKYVVVLVNEQVTIKDGDDLQNYDMSKNAVFKEVNSVMSGMLNGKMLEDRSFESLFFENDKEYKVVLKPKVESVRNFITEINVLFDKNDYSTKQVVLFEKEGDKTIIKFNNTKTNTPIDDAVFKNI